MELVFEFGYRLTVGAQRDIGTGPAGHRLFLELSEGTVTGDRISGTVGPGAGDWMIAGGDGYNAPDARMIIDTADGAVLYVRSEGVFEVTPQANAALEGREPSQFEDHYFRLFLRIESGDERYAWVNNTLFVARGRLLPGPVAEFEAYRVL